MNIFEKGLTYNAITLSGVPYSFRDVLTSDCDMFISQLSNKLTEKDAVKGFLNRIVIEVGGEKIEDINDIIEKVIKQAEATIRKNAAMLK